MNFFEGTTLVEPPFFLAFSGRNYPNHKRKEFLAGQGLRFEDLVLVRQVHGGDVAVIDAHSKASSAYPADALVTSLPGPVLGILTADCIPVFFWDRAQKAAGIAHAGWRGLKAGILNRTIEVLRMCFHSQPSDLQILLGPSIRGCCYEVGEEFQAYFPSQYKVPDRDSGNASAAAAEKRKGRVNLIGAAFEQLSREGIAEQNIRDSGICTACSKGSFFSARREGTPERILSVIQIRPE